MELCEFRDTSIGPWKAFDAFECLRTRLFGKVPPSSHFTPEVEGAVIMRTIEGKGFTLNNL